VSDLSDQAKRFDDLEALIQGLGAKFDDLQRSVGGLERSSNDQSQHLYDMQRSMDRVAHRVSSLESKSTLHRYTASGQSSLHTVELIPDGKELHAPQRRWRKLVRGRD
jgi:hypothetical protein